MSTDSEKSSASATVSDSSKDLSATSEEIPSSDDMPQALPYIYESSPVESPQEESIDDSLMFSEFPSKGIVTAVFSESSDEEDPPVPASQENMLVEPSQLNRSRWNFVCNFRHDVYLKSAIKALSNPDRSEKIDVADNGFNIDVPARFRSKASYGKKFSFLALSQELVENEGAVYLGNHTGTDKVDIRVLVAEASIESSLGHLLNPARFLCTKLSLLVFPQRSADVEDGTTASLASPEGSDTVKRFFYLVLPQELAKIEEETTVYPANRKGSAALDFPFIIELTRIHHFPPFRGVAAQVGQGNQQQAIIGGAGLGLGMMGQQNPLQGGPQAIPAVAQGVNLVSDFQIVDVRVAATEDPEENDREIIREYIMPENHATSWGWLAQEVYDEYLTRHPNQPIQDGIRLNPYLCWPGRSVSYTSLGGQLYVWPNTPWETVKYGLKNITLRGGWV